MKTPKLTNRRKFLMAASLGTAGVAATVATGGRSSAAKDDAAVACAKPTGYHVTEHIQKYYKTTEV